MPRFVGRRFGVEAHQWTGHTHMLPEAFRLAVCRHLVGGMIEIRTGDGPRVCKHEDWIVAGPDGTFSVVRNAAFETMFEPRQEAPAPLPIPVPARVEPRRKANG